MTRLSCRDFVAKQLIIFKVMRPLQSPMKSQVSPGRCRCHLYNDFFAAVEATGLTPVRFKFGRSFSTHVQIDAGNLSWTTPGVRWRKNERIRWDDTIVLLVLILDHVAILNLTSYHRPPLARSTKVIFSLFRNKTLIGRAEIDLTDALAKSELHLNEGTSSFRSFNPCLGADG